MSLILDALKKSETDRQKQSGPGIADVPVATPGSGAPKWLPIGIGLLAVNLLVLIFVLLRPAPRPSAVEAAAVVPAGELQVARIDPGNSGDVAGTAATRDAIGDPEVPPAAPVSEAAAPRSAVNTADVPAQPVERSTPLSAPAPDSIADTGSLGESYLTFNDLRARGVLDLPDLHVDLHVYSSNPAERFVFINMDKHLENDVLGAGPRLREITPEGVILDYRGTTFLLPRE